VPASAAESASAWLLERFPRGCEELDLGEVTELAVYTDDAGVAAVRATYPEASADDVAPGWEDRWKDFHRPVRAGGLWIGPPWIEPPREENVVVVDPGRAFGTGAHATTRACIELLARCERGSVLDAGCGSGVVSVAAVRLGFGPVRAVDLDEVAVDVANETARANRVDVRVSRADVLRDELPDCDLVVANIELRVVERLLPRVPAEAAVTSGYVASETPRADGWTAVERLELEGWAADVWAKRH
jgi:ribosomal protein L11 methyltransferase